MLLLCIGLPRAVALAISSSRQVPIPPLLKTLGSIIASGLAPTHLEAYSRGWSGFRHLEEKAVAAEVAVSFLEAPDIRGDVSRGARVTKTSTADDDPPEIEIESRFCGGGSTT